MSDHWDDRIEVGVDHGVGRLECLLATAADANLVLEELMALTPQRALATEASERGL